MELNKNKNKVIVITEKFKKDFDDLIKINDLLAVLFFLTILSLFCISIIAAAISGLAFTLLYYAYSKKYNQLLGDTDKNG